MSQKRGKKKNSYNKCLRQQMVGGGMLHAISSTPWCLMLPASRRPTALRGCQHSRRDTFTLYLTSTDSLQRHGWTRLYTQEIQTPAQHRTTQASDRTLHVNPPKENKPSGGEKGKECVRPRNKSIKSNLKKKNNNNNAKLCKS